MFSADPHLGAEPLEFWQYTEIHSWSILHEENLENCALDFQIYFLLGSFPARFSLQLWLYFLKMAIYGFLNHDRLIQELLQDS